MKILGIDPGLTQTGYGIISSDGKDLTLVDYGVIRPDSKDQLPNRLLTIFHDVKQVIEMNQPSVFIIEDVFYGKNVRSLLMLGQARGAAILAASELKIPIFEYSAKKVKQSITGNGNAHKLQVQFMVKTRLKLKELPQPIDASDALAVALCHYQQTRINEL